MWRQMGRLFKLPLVHDWDLSELEPSFNRLVLSSNLRRPTSYDPLETGDFLMPDWRVRKRIGSRLPVLRRTDMASKALLRTVCDDMSNHVVAPERR